MNKFKLSLIFFLNICFFFPSIVLYSDITYGMALYNLYLLVNGQATEMFACFIRDVQNSLGRFRVKAFNKLSVDKRRRIGPASRKKP